jgi:hypothetical protein
MHALTALFFGLGLLGGALSSPALVKRTPGLANGLPAVCHDRCNVCINIRNQQGNCAGDDYRNAYAACEACARGNGFYNKPVRDEC